MVIQLVIRRTENPIKVILTLLPTDKLSFGQNGKNEANDGLEGVYLLSPELPSS